MTHGTLLDHLRAVLPGAPGGEPVQDDFALYPQSRPASQTEAVAAAVLVPILMPTLARSAPAILFTQRTHTLSRHSGQVSFPGGRRDPADVSDLQTALRETQEETGIASSFISVAGYLARYRTGTGFDIQPVVGLVSDGFALTPDPREVAGTFEVPLDFFLDPANLALESRDIAGQTRRFFAYRPGSHCIWGATAAILTDLVGRLSGRRNATLTS